jgi:hypothetical protein
LSLVVPRVGIKPDVVSVGLATWPPLATVLSAGSVTLTGTVKFDCVPGTRVWFTVICRWHVFRLLFGVGVAVAVAVAVAVGVGVGGGGGRSCDVGVRVSVLQLG